MVPIDREKALAHQFEPIEASWDVDDVILYNLGIGAGRDPMEPESLAWVYEKDLKVLPSFGVVPVFSATAEMFTAPGIDIDPVMILHGQQDLTVHAPLPTEARVVNYPRITEIWDKGKGALINVEVDTVLSDSGDPICTNVFGIFVRGEGGWGGQSGPRPGNEPPDRDPDHSIERSTDPWQALLYRLSGDKNPLHADPDVAQAVGFDQPVLHGLCTYGIVCKAVVDELLGGDPAEVVRYQGRFSKPVIPGETIVVRTWVEDNRILVEASAKQRGELVLSNAAIVKA